MDGVVNEVPVPKLAPPVGLAYQLTIPADAVAPSITVPVPQRLFGVVDVMVGIGLTITEIELLFAGLPTAQGESSEVNSTVTTLPFERVDEVNIGPFTPEINKPLTFHW